LQSVLHRLRYDWMTIAFGLVVLAIVIVAIAAPLIAPFDPYQQSIVGRLKPSAGAAIPGAPMSWAAT